MADGLEYIIQCKVRGVLTEKVRSDDSLTVGKAGGSHVLFWVRKIPGRGDSQSKDTKSGGCLVNSRTLAFRIQTSSLPQLHGWVFIPAIKANSQPIYVKGWEGCVTDNAKITVN